MITQNKVYIGLGLGLRLTLKLGGYRVGVVHALISTISLTNSSFFSLS